jgi:hypothetical protein
MAEFCAMLIGKEVRSFDLGIGYDMLCSINVFLVEKVKFL